MMPAAPTMFSTTMLWPMLAPIFCAIRRAATSTALAAASGTIMRTDRFG